MFKRVTKMASPKTRLFLEKKKVHTNGNPILEISVVNPK